MRKLRPEGLTQLLVVGIPVPVSASTLCYPSQLRGMSTDFFCKGSDIKYLDFEGQSVWQLVNSAIDAQKLINNP